MAFGVIEVSILSHRTRKHPSCFFLLTLDADLEPVAPAERTWSSWNCKPHPPPPFFQKPHMPQRRKKKKKMRATKTLRRLTCPGGVLFKVITYWLCDAIAPGNLRLGSSLVTLGLSWRTAIGIIALGHFLAAILITLNGIIGARLHIP